MSSLSATQAGGYYIQPNYFDSGAYKKKSISQFNNGQQPTKGHNQYLQRSVLRALLKIIGNILYLYKPHGRLVTQYFFDLSLKDME